MDILNQLQGEVNDLIELEDLKWRQRAKHDWLKHGDKNSKFFHTSVNQRRKSNVIKSVLDSDGVVCSILDEIEGAFLGYYQALFGANSATGVSDCLSGIPCTITQEMNELLLKPCTVEEVGFALHNMGPFKAAGPDGFTASFYQQNWATIGDEVCRPISNFIISGYMDEDINFMHIVLIPKKQNAVSVSDFRPIALCNVIYKITSKVLANRLKVILPSIISPLVPGDCRHSKP
jgi:hypothetical protein